MNEARELLTNIQNMPFFLQLLFASLVALVFTLSTTFFAKSDFGHRIAFCCGLAAIFVWPNYNVVLTGAFLLMTGTILHRMMEPGRTE